MIPTLRPRQPRCGLCHPGDAPHFGSSTWLAFEASRGEHRHRLLHNRHPPCDGNTGNIGDNSCNGNGACFSNTGNIGDNSCNGAFACDGNTGTVGDISCTGDDACDANGGTVGDGSCQGTDACDANLGPSATTPVMARTRVMPTTGLLVITLAMVKTACNANGGLSATILAGRRAAMSAMATAPVRLATIYVTTSRTPVTTPGEDIGDWSSTTSHRRHATPDR